GVGDWLAKRLARATGAEARATVLGHVQRGAMPTAEDRLLASALGVRAVDLLAEGKGDHMVAWWNRQVIDVPLSSVVGKSRTVDPDGTLIRTARALGICLGDAV
ncbi:MAG: 6-phosphofructokinase, partial [Rhodospirillales bacterium]|nr:6-phosphofructokinase [Rhodospirillales bacterium]